MRRLIKRIILYINIIFSLMLLLSYLSVYIKPTFFWFLGAVGLAYPILLLINAAFLIFWLVRWKWYFIIPLVAIIIGINHFSSFFQFPFGLKDQSEDADLKIISYNVNLFQLSSWSKEPPSYDKVFEFLISENPDIVCLQEFFVVNGKFSEQQAKEKLDYYVHFGYIVKRQNSGYGLATYSRHPIVYSGEIKFDNSANACIFTDILIENDTVRVYNNHLQSLRLREQNLNFLLDHNYRKEAQTMSEIRDISFRYRDALRKRAEQVEVVTKHILSSPYPVIVCGDFNDSPISYNYRQMRRNLNDAFIEAGTGAGHTYKGVFPSFRIDYVLYNPLFRATSYNTPRIYHSDHYPVVATLRRE